MCPYVCVSPHVCVGAHHGGCEDLRRPVSRLVWRMSVWLGCISVCVCVSLCRYRGVCISVYTLSVCLGGRVSVVGCEYLNVCLEGEFEPARHHVYLLLVHLHGVE